MEATRQTQIRRARHARRLATRAWSEAGTQKAVARATGSKQGTVGHKMTDRPDAHTHRATSLEKYVRCARQLALIERELSERGLDLLALYRKEGK